MKVLTSSSLSAFRDCPRKYFHQYERGRVPLAESEALTLGKWIHAALDAWWRIDGTIQDRHLAAVEAAPLDLMPEQTMARALAMLYHYAPPVDQFNVLAVEQPFEVKIENGNGKGRSFYGYRLAGKIDVVLKRKDTGDIWIMDHKTTTREIVGFGSYWQRLQVDGQMSNYCLAFNARGFIYDALRVPSVRLCGKDEAEAAKTGTDPSEAYMQRCISIIAEDPAQWYQWREYTKTNDDMAEARQDLWQQVEMFRSCDTAARWPRNPNACVGLYGTCPYLDVCTGKADLDDDALFRTKAEAHEELNEL